MRYRLMILLLVVVSASCSSRHWPTALKSFTYAPIPRFEHVLRLSLSALGVEQMPGIAGSAPEMNAFFKLRTP
jgi:hypothetical protein